jgi:hypothetical protein
LLGYGQQFPNNNGYMKQETINYSSLIKPVTCDQKKDSMTTTGDFTLPGDDKSNW